MVSTNSIPQFPMSVNEYICRVHTVVVNITRKENCKMTSSENAMVMPVAPTGYAFNGNGNDGFGFGGGWWIILLLAVLGWGNGGYGFGGNGGMFPWMLGAQTNTNNDVQRGFDQSAVMSGINGIQNGMNAGFAGVQNALCNGFAGVQNGFAQAEIAANGRQMADMNQNFALQTSMLTGFNGLQNALQNCCCQQTANTADLKYTIATEACANRAAGTANTQAILDKLCQLELDGYKSQLDSANNTINQLRTQLLVANNEASQTAQTAKILAGQAAEIDGIWNRLNTCPIPSTPVYGRTNIFSCNGQQTCGCGCGNTGF